MRLSIRPLGQLLSMLGGATVILAGLAGLLLDLVALDLAAGFLGTLVGLLLFPITLLVVPWYAGLALGDWVPLLVSFGGVLLGTLLYCLGQILAVRQWRT